MALANLTTKGQVTIPKEIRESLQLHSGDKIDFFVKESGEAVPDPFGLEGFHPISSCPCWACTNACS
jgi:AbrB family looped-hinge helix DNA binding protein